MARITFTQTRVVGDEHRGTDRETKFEAGKTYEMSDASASHWKKRGVAVDATPPASAPASSRAEPVTQEKTGVAKSAAGGATGSAAAHRGADDAAGTTGKTDEPSPSMFSGRGRQSTK